ncbi:MAG: hypothetical protein EOM49_10925 [Epsilonproteobacteria bacterium]|nr:hypothetical protein [Campylobacterota bacterium]
MAKASINFQKTKHNSVAETTREFEAHYLLPKEHRLENEYWNCGKSDSQIFQDELAKASRKGGRVPKEENSLWEAVINLNKEHRLEDVQRVAKHIEKQFNVICTRIAIHRDEGHINERGIVEYNIHAHLNFVTYKDGKQNWRREHITPQNLSQLQTDIAQTLNMTRGKEGSEAVRLGHKQQRVIAKEREAKENEIVKLTSENRDLKYNFREYQQRITALENESAEDKKSLHRLNTQVKNGEATIQDLEKRLQEALESKKSLETIKDTPKEVKSDFRPVLAPKIAYKTVEVKTGMFGSEKQVVLPKKEALALEVYAEALAEQNKSLKRQNAELKGQNEALQEINGYQEAEITKLSPYKKLYNDLVIRLKAITKIDIDKVEEIINAIRDKFSPFAKTQEAQPKREEKPKEQEQTAPKRTLLEKVEAMKEQGKKNMETVKEFNEATKSKPSRSWQR